MSSSAVEVEPAGAYTTYSQLMKPHTVQVFLGLASASSGDRILYSKDGPAGAPVVSHLPVAILRPASDRAATEALMGRTVVTTRSWREMSAPRLCST